MTLMAMVLAVGLVVDDAIVMLENIQTTLETTTEKMKLVIEKESYSTSQEPTILDNTSYNIMDENITDITNYNIRNYRYTSYGHI